MESETFLQLKKLLKKNYSDNIGIKWEEIDDIDIIDQLGFDSVRLIQLIIDIEEKFDIVLEEEDLDVEQIRTFSGLEKIIDSKLSNK